jgi:alkanesulfonate monooxygenase SsuD/methylene tetrahydromethanopterin reductase-like flavin-dependent oxidoreductase (luciferase family)
VEGRDPYDRRARARAGCLSSDKLSRGLSYEERWKRLDEVIPVLRSLLRRDAEPGQGRFYSTEGIQLRPYPAQQDGPPIWLGSWGSDVGRRRTARLADGWLASAYNTTPEGFADAWNRLQEQLVEHGRSPNGFANALATMWFHLTDDRSEAQRVMRDRALPAINRPEDVLRERLPIGPAEAFAERLAAFRDAGVQRVFICRQLSPGVRSPSPPSTPQLRCHRQ